MCRLPHSGLEKFATLVSTPKEHEPSKPDKALKFKYAIDQVNLIEMKQTWTHH